MSFGTFHKWLEHESSSCTECQKISGSRALYVLALHRVVPRCTPLSATNAFTVVLTSSADLPVALLAVGGARPYLRSVADLG